MAARSRIGAQDPGRLRLLLAGLFLALALPTAVLTWQAWRQLRWEAFHQYRSMAEELASRIDAGLRERVARAEAWGYSDFSFLVLTGDPAANFVQRSPLSEFPVSGELPGVIGYFQVDSEGGFSTPLLPGGRVRPEELGVPADEYRARLLLAGEIRRILTENRLLHGVPGPAGRQEPRELSAAADAEEAAVPASPAADDGAVREAEPERNGPADAAGDADYGQREFDRLTAPQPAEPSTDADDAARQQAKSLGKIADLRLDPAFESKSEGVERQETRANEGLASARRDSAGRAKRIAQEALPSAAADYAAPAASTPEAEAEAAADERRITSFESEIDPFEASLLGSGHLVVFRNVWRDGERHVQGMLIATDRFLEALIEGPYRATGLSATTDLVVAYRDDVIRLLAGTGGSGYSVSAEDLQGALLYRQRLTAPFDRIAMIFSVTQLPPGPGARVLVWTAVVIALVFLGGFYALYRLGLGQIRLARQQQDFVSAVSHELKTPLTSIRMYGEMLREGWVGDDRKQQYYDYIHDEAERLARLIANVLQLARITRNSPELYLERRPVREIMDHVAAKISTQVERAGFALEFRRDEAAEELLLDIDEDSFAQIVINLVDNALKFSKDADNRTIEIGSRRTSAGQVQFTVRDHGPGIARDQLKKVFQLFYRAESELTRETVGTGIGLAIVHQLTQAMGGKADVINRNPGAEFRVEFPVSAQ